jgi:hypothetical protein
MNIVEFFNNRFKLPKFHSFKDLYFCISAQGVVSFNEGPCQFDNAGLYTSVDEEEFFGSGSLPWGKTAKQWRIER